MICKLKLDTYLNILEEKFYHSNPILIRFNIIKDILFSFDNQEYIFVSTNGNEKRHYSVDKSIARTRLNEKLMLRTRRTVIPINESYWYLVWYVGNIWCLDGKYFM